MTDIDKLRIANDAMLQRCASLIVECAQKDVAMADLRQQLEATKKSNVVPIAGEAT